MKSKIVVILISLFVIFLIGELASFIMYRIRYAPVLESLSKVSEQDKDFLYRISPHYRFVKKFSYDRVREHLTLRVHVSTSETKKRPIITMVDSFADGVGLEYNQTFAFKLNKYTDRTTYNRSLSGFGTQHVYRQLIDEKFKSEVPDAEYIIYVFIRNHIYRITRDLFCPCGYDVELRYVLKNGNLVEKKHPFAFLYPSFLVKVYLEETNKIATMKEVEDGFPLFLKLLEASVNQMHKLYPNSKFVCLDFPEGGACTAENSKGGYELDAETIKKIEALGIIYVDVAELVGHNFCGSKYRIEDNQHPSGLVWDELVPELVKKLNL